MIYCVKVKSKYGNLTKKYVFDGFKEIKKLAKNMFIEWDRDKSELDLRSLKSCLIFLYSDNTIIELYKTKSEQIAHEFKYFNKKVNLKKIYG